MADSDYLRVIVSQLHSLLTLQIARDKFGQSYLELSVEQKMQVESLATQMIEHYKDGYSLERVQKILAACSRLEIQ